MNIIAKNELAALREQKVQVLEAGFLQQEQVDCPVVHRFGPGIYIREVTIPAGTFSIGHYQKTTHLNVMLKGRVLMCNEDGTQTELVAPQTFVCGPGRKIGHILEDMTWQNIYATDETNVEVLETMFLEKSDTWKENHKSKTLLLTCDHTEDVKDYFAVLKEFGFDHKTVREQTENLEDQIPFPVGSYKVQLSDSKIDGKGLFATGNFEKDEIIAPGRIDSKRTPAGRYVNHSKTPNALPILRDNGNIDFVALRPIAGCKGGNLGEEITIDYRQALLLAKRS